MSARWTLLTQAVIRDPTTRLIVAGNEVKVKASNVKTVVTNTRQIGNRVQHLERTGGDAKNHFASKCRQDIKAMEEADELTEETYQNEEVAVVKLDDSQLVTLRLGSRRFIPLQPDTGAQCNVLPLHIY